jgi:hypothetical protein
LAWIDSPPSVVATHVLVVATLVLAVGFILGWRYRLVGPLFGVCFMATISVRMSWGHVIHSDHLPALHALLLGFVPAADAWSLDARRRGRRADRLEGPQYGWPIEVITAITVLTYVLAGVAKLRNGGWDWIVGDVLRNQIAYDNLRKVLLGDVHSPIGARLVAHPWVFAPMAWFSLLVELGAPVVWLGRRVRRAWAVSAWLLHAGILAVMAIGFPYPLTGVALASLFAVEQPIERFLAARRSVDQVVTDGVDGRARHAETAEEAFH